MIKIFITDDHYMVVEGIRTMLANVDDVQIIGHASTLSSTRAFMKTGQPDVLLLDINLPDGNGTDLCKELKEKYPKMAILGISTFNQGSYIQEMMDNGASGYILKNTTQKELTEAIHMASIGRNYLPFEVAKTLSETEKQESKRVILSRREIEVLNLLKNGFTNSEIAEKIFLSVNTVDTYRKSLLFKLDAKNTADLIRLAFLHKIITP